MSFRDDFARLPYGPRREQAVYEAAITAGRPTDLDPVTIPGPNGTKITYYVTHDFLKVDGQYLTMTGITAQKVAKYFGMYLPSNKIADQVRKQAIESGNSITVHPLSGTGYTSPIDGKHYSANDVVSGRIGATDAAVEFSNRVNDALNKNQSKNKGPINIESGGKYITLPPADGSLGLHGIWQPGGAVQGGYGTIHPANELHAEYGTYVRLVAPKVDVTYPDGRKETMNMEQFVKTDLRSAMFQDGQDIRNGGIAQYDETQDKAGLAAVDKRVGPGGSDSASELPDAVQKIDESLNQVQQQIAARMAIYERILKLAKFDQSEVQIMSSIGKDPIIKDLSKSSIPGHAPDGFEPLPPGENAQAVGYAARTILENSSLGDQVPFKIGDQLYMGRSEPHFHPGPTPEERKTMSQAELDAKYPAKPWYWHRGVTVFKAKEGTQAPSGGAEQPGENTPASGTQGRMSLIQRIDNFLGGLGKELG